MHFRWLSPPVNRNERKTNVFAMPEKVFRPSHGQMRWTQPMYAPPQIKNWVRQAVKRPHGSVFNQFFVLKVVP